MRTLKGENGGKLRPAAQTRDLFEARLPRALRLLLAAPLSTTSRTPRARMAPSRGRDQVQSLNRSRRSLRTVRRYSNGVVLQRQPDAAPMPHANNLHRGDKGSAPMPRPNEHTNVPCPFRIVGRYSSVTSTISTMAAGKWNETPGHSDHVFLCRWAQSSRALAYSPRNPIRTTGRRVR